MRECVIIGRPNSGKTMFALNFAKYLGIKNVDLTLRTYDGLMTCRHFSIDEAMRELCSMALHKTRSLQSMILNMTVGKTTINFKLTDTCGVSEQIHNEEAVRKGMAQTLGQLRVADLIIHIVDLTQVTKDFVTNKAIIDHEFYNYGLARNAYVLIGNKIDLVSAKDNLPRLSAAFPRVNIVPVSALYGKGFKEVKAYVARNI